MNGGATVTINERRAQLRRRIARRTNRETVPESPLSKQDPQLDAALDTILLSPLKPSIYLFWIFLSGAWALLTLSVSVGGAISSEQLSDMAVYLAAGGLAAGIVSALAYFLVGPGSGHLKVICAPVKAKNLPLYKRFLLAFMLLLFSGLPVYFLIFPVGYSFMAVLTYFDGASAMHCEKALAGSDALKKNLYFKFDSACAQAGVPVADRPWCTGRDDCQPVESASDGSAADKTSTHPTTPAPASSGDNS